MRYLLIVLMSAFLAVGAANARSANTITQNVCCLTYGTVVTFTPSPDNTGTFTFSDQPAGQQTQLITDCYQGKDWVYEAISTNAAFNSSTPWYSIELDQSGDMRTPYAIARGHGILWDGNAADCTVVSGYYQSRTHFVTTGSLDFSVAA